MGPDSKIHSDSYFIFKIVKELFLYIILLIPRLFLLLFFFVIGSQKKSLYFEKIFLEPFKLFHELSNWFFEAKFTFYLILILIFIFLLQVFIFDDFGNFLSTSPQDLFSFNFYTIFTSIFLHGSIYHLLSNILVLFFFGRIVEKEIGSQIFLIFILGGIISNIISHLISFIFGDFFSSWGASGAISAIVILGIFLSPIYLILGFLPSFILGWLFIFSDLSGLFLDDGINHFAHLGGYLGIVFLVYFLEKSHIKKVFLGFIFNILLVIISFLLIYNKELFGF